MNEEKLLAAVREQIEVTVNGKITKLTNLVETHINEDKEWKEQFKPLIEFIPQLNSTGRITKAFNVVSDTIIFLSKPVVATAAIIGVIVAFIKFVVMGN